MNHELIEILKAFVLRDNGHRGLHTLCTKVIDANCTGMGIRCDRCLMVKAWIGKGFITDMYLENTLRNLNEPRNLIDIKGA